MGLFDFLRKLFGESPPAPRRQPPPLPVPPRASQAPAPQTSWPPPPQIGLPPTVSLPPVQPATPVRTPAPPAPQRPKDVTLDLDASQFQPLSTEQVKAQAAGAQFSGWWEFGRRDRIPGDIDPRTKLIDQAMVGQGLITADELARIHEIGR